MTQEPSAVPPVSIASADTGGRAAALYSVATSFDAGTEPRQVAIALIRRFAAATGARSGWLLPAGEGCPAHSWPDPGFPPPSPHPTAVMTIPLLHAGLPVGTLVLGEPAAGSFGTAERRLAQALAHPAGAVAAAVRRLAAAEEAVGRADDAAALLAEVMAAVDHDLRAPLTTILGALQTLTRPEHRPGDSDLGALLDGALEQARRLRFLLGDLQLAAPSASRRETLPPAGLQALIAEAARSGMGATASLPIEVPSDFPPAAVDPPALRRTLDGVLRRACRLGLAARVEVAAWGDDAMIAVTAHGTGSLVPPLSARLAEAMGASLQESAGTDATTVVQLRLPAALRRVPSG
ncbi:MAG: HAMP domain-containing histidine kinase [Actinobacteria bacterium]|nr:HAMP domain-containing histidine kinase [Actinomycetota bacterium]